MRDFELIKNLIGETVSESDLKFVDCYVQKKLGLFIPTCGSCGYAMRENHSHPAYMAVIDFSDTREKANHYTAGIFPPDFPHNDRENLHYYCVMIDRDFFESQYSLYSGAPKITVPIKFEMCSDILKALNTFAFEYSKSMANSDITLDAQATIITHWIIRSVLGETLDMRAVSSDYSIARAQHYIEHHFPEKITVADLAALGYMSVSSLNRKFRSEVGKTPAEYLTEVRINHAKTLLRRKNISVTEIALRCGFGSGAHFSSCFIKHMGITPSEYQSRYID